MFTSLLTLFVSTAVFWWDEIIAPLLHAERPKVVQWIIAVPWYYSVFVGMVFVVTLIGEAAFRHIKEQDDAIEALEAKVRELQTEEEIQSRLGDLLNEGSELRIEEVPSAAHLEAWLTRYEGWREEVLDTLGTFGLAADYSLFQNADTMEDQPPMLPTEWQQQVWLYDRTLKIHMRALAGIIKTRPKVSFPVSAARSSLSR